MSGDDLAVVSGSSGGLGRAAAGGLANQTRGNKEDIREALAGREQ